MDGAIATVLISVDKMILGVGHESRSDQDEDQRGGQRYDDELSGESAL